MANYLITGGSGFIGSNFVSFVLERHPDALVVNADALSYAGNPKNNDGVKDSPRYRFIKADIRDEATMTELFKEWEFDYAVNFAAESHVDRSIMEPEVFVSTNVGGTVALMNAAKNVWMQSDGTFRRNCKFLQVSTDEVYGTLGGSGYFYENSHYEPQSPYAASKASAELFAKAYWDTFRFPVIISRCTNNFGPFQHPEKLIPLTINNALNRRPIPVYGDGLQVRDWLYVEDHCRALDDICLKCAPGEIYNIGGNCERTNLEIVRKILHMVGAGEELITHVEDRKGHDRRYALNADKIKKELGWVPVVPFEEGLQKTVSWVLENREWMEDAAGKNYMEYYEKQYTKR